MNCPVCGERLRTIDRSGIEVDICPSCKGIWLDRGELDKLIAMEGNAPDTQRMVSQTPPPQRPPYDRDRREEYREHDDDHYRRDEYRRSQSDHGYDRRGGHKRRSSWLGEILGGLGGDDD